jgi:hypothetical protein
MSILSSIASALLPTASPQDLETVKAQLRNAEAQHQSARSARSPSYPSDDPRTVDHDLIVAEWGVRVHELREKINQVDPVAAALRAFLVASLRAAHDGLAEIDAASSKAAPSVPTEIDVNRLRELSDAYLSQASDTTKQRREEICARLHADICAYLASREAADAARFAAKLPNLPRIAGADYLNALGHAARLGKASVREIDERLREIGQPEPTGALYTARVSLRELQKRREGLERLQAERKRKADEFDTDQRRARGAGLSG